MWIAGVDFCVVGNRIFENHDLNEKVLIESLKILKGVAGLSW